MIGAEVVVRTLDRCGVDVCFADPGTSEMHFLSALNSAPDMRPVLVLQENAATGRQSEVQRDGRHAADQCAGVRLPGDAQGMGVAADRGATAEELDRVLRDAFAQPGPRLIEVSL